MLDLAKTNPNIGKFLLNKVDPLLFKQLTFALTQHQGMALDMVTLVSMFRENTLAPNSSLLKAVSSWQSLDNDEDGTEIATERVIYSVFRGMNATNFFLPMVQIIFHYLAKWISKQSTLLKVCLLLWGTLKK